MSSVSAKRISVHIFKRQADSSYSSSGDRSGKYLHCKRWLGSHSGSGSKDRDPADLPEADLKKWFVGLYDPVQPEGPVRIRK
jgi:hypothetical protein